MILMTALVLASILLVSLSLSAIVVNGLKMGSGQFQSTKAYFAAEAGAERILWEIRKNSNNPGMGTSGDLCDVKPADFCFDNLIDGDLIDCSNACTVKDQKLGNESTYNIVFNYDTKTILKSYGSFGDVNRIIELKY